MEYWFVTYEFVDGTKRRILLGGVHPLEWETDYLIRNPGRHLAVYFFKEVPEDVARKVMDEGQIRFEVRTEEASYGVW